MKTLTEEIQDILTPHQGISFVKEGKIYQLHPIMFLSDFIEFGKKLPPSSQSNLQRLLEREDIVIFNGIIYTTLKGLKLKGRLKEIITVYNQHIKNVVGERKTLIELYQKIPAQDIANLTENHIIFVMKELIRDRSKKALAAIRYLSSYQIHFEKFVYQMPPCTIAVRIDENFHLMNPEVIAENNPPFYEHPFVYRDNYNFGQKICMGSFYHSSDEKAFNRLRFANNLSSLMRQAVQILITGYNRDVSPANGHLGTSQYAPYLKKNADSSTN
ncbi:MAG: hypothetical protein DRO88_11395 [Promethearchaeia archaeon]|nr:MAG: hypothetical protein DRO88_11395 [Candidatus Lokiarchaeia archaeon]